MEIGFPHVQTVLHIRRRGQLKGRAAEWEEAYYLCSQPLESRTPEQWLQVARDHWAGIEIRNHWRKDACLFEDKTRSRNANLVGCLMLLRNLVLHLYVQHQDTYDTLPAFVETVAARASFALSLIRSST
jgi:hypothetical protein